MKDDNFEENKLFNTYVLYELLYEEKMKDKFGQVPIYPKRWYSFDNYEEKIKILEEAIYDEKQIIDTESYNIFINNIFYNKKLSK